MRKINHEILKKIAENSANLESLARLGSGSKTNDKIIRASVRDLAVLIRFAKRNLDSPIVKVVTDANDIVEDVRSRFKQLNLFSNEKL